MTNNPQWQQDLQWLLANTFVGHGGLKRLVDPAYRGVNLLNYSRHISYQTVWNWKSGLRTPNHDNQRALRMLRTHEGGEE